MTRQNAEHGGEVEAWYETPGDAVYPEPMRTRVIPSVGCGSCGKELSPDRRTYTGSAAYCEDCASDVYGDHFRVAPSAPTHADEGGAK